MRAGLSAAAQHNGERDPRDDCDQQDDEAVPVHLESTPWLQDQAPAWSRPSSRGRTIPGETARSGLGAPGRAIFTNFFVLCDLEHELAHILTGEQLLKRLRKALEALYHILARNEPPVGDPAGHLTNGLRGTAHVVEHHEPLHAGTVDEQ